MQISGFSIIRDGRRFGYPFVESVRSLLPLVDELVIAVGNSADDTLAALQAIDSPKLVLFETEWDPALQTGGRVLAQQTNLALERCRGEWCFYLQADELIHENDHDSIRQALRRYDDQPHVEGLSFRYKHFWGGYNIRNPLAYRKQVRIIRNGRGIRSVGDACGFGLDGRKLVTRPSGAWIYHYGWVRPPEVMGRKMHQFRQFYMELESSRRLVAESAALPDPKAHEFDLSGCVPYYGSHPAVMAPVIAAQDWETPAFHYTPRWRNRTWWRGIFKKNFGRVYRKFYPDPKSEVAAA